MRLLVSVTGLAPGAPLGSAVALCDALDERRIPLTLLLGPRPHPEVTAFAAARRRAGDAVLLHGFRSVHDPLIPRRSARPGVRPYRRLPVLEARLRLAGASRSAEALGLAVDGFAAPGWAASAGTRRALAEAGLDLLLDDAGVHRLGPGGVPTAGVAGPVVDPGRPGRAPLRTRLTRTRRPDVAAALTHLTVDLSAPVGPLLHAVDATLAEGALPTAATDLVGKRRRRTADGSVDPELWSTTA
ncbi:DUF2334 domain-containing protein [Actinomycetospora termitidis]|uniref:DUF2334 domain-containing protein n=1 Tax=Actinomycetospora termitidis TaxID=3053470 RepID=A0ABT7M4C9_9PSEU|nr:DUF2334 domain-containing protein [Actinomycetospora sp. Odt1-22]MDL5155084.1 DUF2334 domain-containing protein [Actinomycetospora sp. Odt1-22]